MPPGIFSFWHLMVLLVVVVLVFGTKKLKGVGQDLGDAVKGFRNAMAAGDKDAEPSEPRQIEPSAQRPVVDRPSAQTKSQAGAASGAGRGPTDWPNS